MLGEVNAAIASEDSEAEKEHLPESVAMNLICANHPTERQKKRKERNRMSRRAGVILAHAYAIDERELDIGHVVGEPSDRSLGIEGIFDTLRNQSADNDIAEQQSRPTNFIKEQTCHEEVGNPFADFRVVLEDKIKAAVVVSIHSQVERTFLYNEQDDTQNDDERGREAEKNGGQGFSALVIHRLYRVYCGGGYRESRFGGFYWKWVMGYR